MWSFKKKIFPFIGIILLFLTQFTELTVPTTFAQGCNATGLVYRDYDQDGTQDALEPPVAGIEVRAYDAAGVQAGPVTTGVNGQYTLPLSSSQARIEFTIPASMNYLRYGRVWDGTTSTQSTSVNFADCTSGSPVFNMGVNNPGQYCEPDPALATTCFTVGPQTNGTDPVLISFPSSSGSGAFGGPYPAPPNVFDLPLHTDLATEVNIGTTWGLAYHRPSDTIFASAFMKRHVGMGPSGTGAIYAIRNGTTSVFSNSINGGPDLHPLDTDPFSDWLHDLNTWDSVGKAAFGDIDISDDMSTLWAMNLADRSLYSIQINGTNNPTAGAVASHAVPLNQGDCPNPNTDIRPFALEIKDNLVYVGVVCSGESTPGVTSNLRGYVYTFNPATSAWAQVFNFALNYPRGCVNLAPSAACANFPAEWNTWSTTFTGLGIPGQPLDGIVYPQPWLTDIVFDNDNMILGLRDRFGDQVGSGAYSTNPADPVNYIGVAGGDILRACSDGAGGWILEGSVGCPTNSANGQGPGGGEYYFEDDLATRHDELFMGGLVQIPGQPEVAGTFVDPIRITGPNDVLWDGGVRWLSNTSGQTTRAYRLVNGDFVLPPTAFGKANGLGDLAALCGPAPIEIGNRVWYDVNENGIQDPDLAAEAPVGGVSVRLYSGGTLVGQTTTAADGTYYFNETNVTGSLQPGQFYNIRLDNAADYAGAGPLAGWTLTDNDLGTDVSDSDGTFVNGFPNIRVQIGNFGENNHTLDFGFFQGPTPTPETSVTPGTPPPPGTPGPTPSATPPTPIFNKQANPPFAQPGDLVNWVITVFNPTDITQTDISVTDNIPDALEIVNVTATAGNATWSGQTVTFTMASLAPQQTVVITITTRVRPGAPYVIENEALLRSINWGGVGEGINARAQVVLANQQPGTGETPWWRLPLLVAGIALGLAALRLTLSRRGQS